MARIYREMPLNSIWEGAGNIMALDLLRVLRRQGRGRGAGAGDRAGARRAPGARPRGAARAGRHRRRWPTKRRRAAWRATSRCCCRPRCCSAAAPAVFAAFCASRLDGAADVFGLLPARHRLRRDHAARDARHCTERDADERADPAPLPDVALLREGAAGAGLKQLPWRSVTSRSMMPKPDVVALTGGYRQARRSCRSAPTSIATAR